MTRCPRCGNSVDTGNFGTYEGYFCSEQCRDAGEPKKCSNPNCCKPIPVGGWIAAVGANYCSAECVGWASKTKSFDDMFGARRKMPKHLMDSNTDSILDAKVYLDQIRTFTTGATRSALNDKPQYEGYLSPIVIKRFGEYMLKHQTQADGTQRAADNWQKGIDKASYMDSLYRHVVDVWLHHRGFSDQTVEPLEDALSAVMFNAMGYLFEVLKDAD